MPAGSLAAGSLKGVFLELLALAMGVGRQVERVLARLGLGCRYLSLGRFKRLLLGEVRVCLVGSSEVSAMSSVGHGQLFVCGVLIWQGLLFHNPFVVSQGFCCSAGEAGEPR